MKVVDKNLSFSTAGPIILGWLGAVAVLKVDFG